MIAKYYLRYRSIFGKGARNWNITLTTERKNYQQQQFQLQPQIQYIVLVKNNTQDWKDFQKQSTSTVQGGKMLGLYSLKKKQGIQNMKN